MEEPNERAAEWNPGRRRIAQTAAAFTLYATCNWLLTNKFFPLATSTALFSRDIGTLAQGLALVAVALLATRRPHLLRGWMFRELPLALLVCGMALVVGGTGRSEPIVTVGVTLVELTSAFVIVSIGCALMDLGTRRAGPCILAGLTVSFALRLPLDALAGMAATVCVFGLASAALVILPASAAQRALADIQRGETPRELSLTNPFSFLPPNHQLFVCLLLFQLGYGYAIGFGEIGDTPLSTFGGIVPLALVCLVLGLRRRLPAIDPLFAVALLLAIAGYLSVPLSHDRALPLASNLLEAGSSCFSLVYWLCVVSLANRNRAGALTLFAWGGSILSVGVVGGAWLGRLTDMLLASNPGGVGIACNCAALALVAYALLALRRFSFDATIEGLPASPAHPGGKNPGMNPHADGGPTGEAKAAPGPERADALRALAATYGLTPREAQVFELLAQGRNGVFIQGKLGVTYNTVKTHVGHVYTKLGVHTHQELIDLVEGSSGR